MEPELCSLDSYIQPDVTLICQIKAEKNHINTWFFIGSTPKMMENQMQPREIQTHSTLTSSRGQVAAGELGAYGVCVCV